LVAALLKVAGVTAGLAESNGSLYRRVYDSRHLHNRVWAAFTLGHFGDVLSSQSLGSILKKTKSNKTKLENTKPK